MTDKLLSFSSITKKIVMALAGLFLAVFLLVHLTINLMLLLNDNGKMFTAAAHFMSTNIIIKVFEIVLFGGFIIHMIFGLWVTFKNWAARPVGYFKSNKSETSFFSKYMFHTGVIIGIFLLLHFINFYFVKLGLVNPPAGLDTHDFYGMALVLFHSKVYSFIYIIFFIFLGFHLNHSIQSAFQTIGINHNTYIKTVKIISTVYSVIVAVGFSIIPLYFMFFFK